MKLIQLEQGKSLRLFYVVAGLVISLLLITIKQDDALIVLLGISLSLVSVFPIYIWLLNKAYGLPIWPVFAATNGISAALPMVQDSKNLEAYSSGEVYVGALTLIGFILFGTLIWRAVSTSRLAVPRNVLMLSGKHTERYLFLFIVLGIVYYMSELGNWSILPGNLMQFFRGIAAALNTFGIFVLAFYDGQGLLTRWQSISLVILATLTALVAAASLIMATALVPVAMLLMGYALGGSKIPWRALAIVLSMAFVLHPGKFAMRNAYWGEGAKRFTLETLPEFYIDWFDLGLKQIGSSIGLSSPLPEEEKQSTLFERSGTLHMLLLVQKKSPDEVPFLMGSTYEPIPRLLIPRILDKEKGLSHSGNILLSTTYDLQTLEQTKTTSIAWGLVPEAYANFGYLGVVILAIFLAILYGLIARTTVAVPMTSLRFVIGLLIMAAATKADTMGIFISSQFQGVVAIVFAGIFLMKKQENPFFDEVEKKKEQNESAGSGERLLNEFFPAARWNSRASGRFTSGRPRWMPRGREVVELGSGKRYLAIRSSKFKESNRLPPEV